MKNRIILTGCFALIVCLFFSAACTKSPTRGEPPIVDSIPTTNPVDTTKSDSSLFEATNTWSCVVDGSLYSGTVDTSFITLEVITNEGSDSIIVCTGTTTDKKENIHFSIALNRTKYPATGVNNNYNSYLVFDKDASNLFFGHVSSPYETEVNYKIDTLANNNVVVSCDGSLLAYDGVVHTIKGKFSASLNKGDHEPKKYGFTLEDMGSNFPTYSGYFTSAQMNANALVLHGLLYTGYPEYTFDFVIRTGGVLQPGTYDSKNGDVLFYCENPTSFTDDSTGHMTVTIDSVRDNIAHAHYSGVDKSNRSLAGYFSCRVSNYQPDPNTAYRWAFSTFYEPGSLPYECYAGNMTRAVSSSDGTRNYLTLTGETDNGESAFTIVLSSIYPIVAGSDVYATSDYGYHIDSFYFSSRTPNWDGSFSKVNPALNYGGVSCRIDTLDSRHVTGRFYGNADTYAGLRLIDKASFSAPF